MSLGTGPEFPGDPYAPPRSQEDEGRPKLAPRRVRFELGPILSATWSIYRARLGTCTAVSGTFVGLLFLVQRAQRLVLDGALFEPETRVQLFLVQFGTFFAVHVFTSWLAIGQNLALLGIARGETPVFSRLFRGFPFLLTSLLAGVLFGLAVGLPVLVLLALGGILGPEQIFLSRTLGMIVGLGVAVYPAALLSQYHFLIIDEHLGVLESLGRSWQLTRGRVATILLVWMTVVLLIVAGFIACFVGLLITIPFSYLLMIVSYLSLTDQLIGAGHPTPPGWDEPVE